MSCSSLCQPETCAIAPPLAAAPHQLIPVEIGRVWLIKEGEKSKISAADG
jgi:hypothetical protein